MHDEIQSLVNQNQTASCHITVAWGGPVTNISGLQRQILLNHKMSIQYRDTVISVFTVFNRTWVAIESHYNCCDSILTIAVMFYRGAVWAHPVPPKREGCDSTGFGLLWGYVIVVYVRPHVQHNIRSMYKQNYACLYVYTMFRLSAKICLLEDWNIWNEIFSNEIQTTLGGGLYCDSNLISTDASQSASLAAHNGFRRCVDT